MLSFFSAPVVQTHFEKSVKLKELCRIIHELQKQENKLCKIVEDNPAHLAYRKSKTLSAIMANVMTAIKEFNELKFQKADEEFAAIIVLISKIKKTINCYLEQHQDILNEPRNNQKEIAKNTLSGAGLAGVAGAAVTLGFIGGLATLAASDTALYGIFQAAGLEDKRTKTVQLLEETVSIIDTIQRGLEFEANELGESKKVQESIPLVCPITQDKIKVPVLCTLDGRLYEKEAIVKWLNEKRTSPVNRKKLKDDQSAEDVLVENISLRDAIAELETQFKKAIREPDADHGDRKELK